MLEPLNLDEIAERDQPAICAIVAWAEERVGLGNEMSQLADSRIAHRQCGIRIGGDGDAIRIGDWDRSLVDAGDDRRINERRQRDRREIDSFRRLRRDWQRSIELPACRQAHRSAISDLIARNTRRIYNNMIK